VGRLETSRGGEEVLRLCAYRFAGVLHVGRDVARDRRVPHESVVLVVDLQVVLGLGLREERER
jgi:hypothetical protein